MATTRLTRKRLGLVGLLRMIRYHRTHRSMTTSPRLYSKRLQPILLTQTHSWRGLPFTAGFNVGCMDPPSTEAMQPTSSESVRVKEDRLHCVDKGYT